MKAAFKNAISTAVDTAKAAVTGYKPVDQTAETAKKAAAAAKGQFAKAAPRTYGTFDSKVKATALNLD